MLLGCAIGGLVMCYWGVWACATGGVVVCYWGCGRVLLGVWSCATGGVVVCYWGCGHVLLGCVGVCYWGCGHVLLWVWACATGGVVVCYWGVWACATGVCGRVLLGVWACATGGVVMLFLFHQLFLTQGRDIILGDKDILKEDVHVLGKGAFATVFRAKVKSQQDGVSDHWAGGVSTGTIISYVTSYAI